MSKPTPGLPTKEDKNINPPILYARFISSPHFTLTAGPSKKAFYIHKELLSKISPELRKHIYNEMKEGKENAMALPDVLEDTVARFIEWAYTNDYTEEVNLPLSDNAPEPEVSENAQRNKKSNRSGNSDIPSSRLLLHGRLHVFADRFNIPALKSLTFDKLKILLKSINFSKHPEDVSDLIELLTYCFDNLLTDSRERLLIHLSTYAAWNFEHLRRDPAFWTLTSSNHDFVKSLLQCLNKGSSPPWDDKDEPGGNLKPKSAFLKRRCNSCSYVGIFRLQCGSCTCYDMNINDCGEMIDLDKIKNITGEGANLRITCWSCGWKGMPRLYCGKCNYAAYSYV